MIIFVIVVIAVVVIFGYFNGLFKFVSPVEGSVMASGVFALPGGGGSTGNLIVQVRDTGHVSITGVAVACPTTQFASSDCGGLQINVNGSELSARNALSYGQTGSGSGSVQSAPGTTFTPGAAVTVTVTVSFSDGSTIPEALILPAQAG